MSEESFSMGILLDEPMMERWAAEAVAQAIRDAEVTVELVLLSSDRDPDSRRSLRSYATSAIGTGAWAPVLGWHRLVRTPSYFQKVPIDELDWSANAQTQRVTPEPAEGIGQTLPAEVIDHIESAAVDVLFRRGFGILQGDILTAPRYGVLSYHHGNIREYRGVPPGVWEFAHDESSAGITLQRLNETLDGGEIVVEKDVMIDDLPTWQAVERRLFDRSTDMLATACRRLRDPEFEPTVAEELGPMYTCPGPLDTARIELKNVRGKLTAQFG